jgi:uncharacterized membrane protein YhaH (DUF805 family)
VSFVESIRVCFSKYATFTGRARRSEYWWFALLGFLVYFVAAVLDAVAHTPAFVVIAILGLLVPSLAVAVRRLHDTGRSGWWYFISLVPLIGGIILLVYLASDSALGTNAYGDSPKDGPYPGGGYDGGNFAGGQYGPGQ